MGVHREFLRSLPVRLTREELQERGAQLAATALEVARLKEAAKAKQRELKNAIDTKKEDAAKLARIVHSRSEDRLVSCVEVDDRARMMVETHRLDTGDVVDSRPMSDRERAEALQGLLTFERVPDDEDGDVNPETGEVGGAESDGSEVMQ